MKLAEEKLAKLEQEKKDALEMMKAEGLVPKESEKGHLEESFGSESAEEHEHELDLMDEKIDLEEQHLMMAKKREEELLLMK